jgi:hypothetical protein
MTPADRTAVVIAGEPDGTLPEIGAVYDVRHSRKGSFRARVEAVRGEWIDLTVVEGTARAIMSYNVAYEGDHVTVRDSHTYLTKVPS